MTAIFGILMILAAAAYVAAPFWRMRPGPEPATEADPTPHREQLERQKREAYAAIKEAEFDYQTNKLSEADLRATREKYTAQALEAIAALQVRPTAAARRAAVARPARVAFCPSCGRQVTPKAKFCAGCGRALREAAA
jgi:hypothetical protein